MFDALSIELIQNFVWRSLRYCLTYPRCSAEEVLHFFFYFFKDHIVFLTLFLTLFTHNSVTVSPSLCFNLRLPGDFSIAWSISVLDLQWFKECGFPKLGTKIEENQWYLHLKTFEDFNVLHTLLTKFKIDSFVGIIFVVEMTFFDLKSFISVISNTKLYLRWIVRCSPAQLNSQEKNYFF